MFSFERLKGQSYWKSNPLRTGSIGAAWTPEEMDESTIDFHDTVIINVGGECHEALRSTIQSRHESRLSNKEQLELHFRKDKNEYYFDRHPKVFISILNYLRTGELHAPVDVCGSVFRQELNYWGVNELKLQQCCWIRYCSDIDTKNTLTRFEKVNEVKKDEKNISRWKVFRSKVWQILDEPHTCILAKIYAGFSLLLILLSIGVFCAATHPSIKGNLTTNHYADYYGKDPSLFTGDGYMYYDAYNSDHFTSDNDIATTSEIPTFSEQSKQEVPAKERKLRKMINTQLIPPNPTLDLINMICVLIFTAEIIARFIFCPRKSKYFTNALNIIDIIAVLPFYIEEIVHSFHTTEKYKQSIVDVLFLLQILRIVRIFRLMRHVKGLRVLVFTIKHSWKEMLLMLIFLLIGMLLYGSLIYYTEYGAQEKIVSIPHGFWWAMVTMTTVGYGDMYPVTNWGYVVGTFCVVTGVLVIAFSVPSLVNNFMLFYSYVQYEKKDHFAESKLSKPFSKGLNRKITPKEIHPKLEGISSRQSSVELGDPTLQK